MTPDQELLGEFTRTGSEAAFATLVQRHLSMVYHAALRRVGGDAHAAHDVTQRVFSDLARKAPRLVGHPNLAGWLHRGTRFAAAEFVRGERRRRAREREAQAMNMNDAEPVPEAALHGVIDEILDSLSEKDRMALVMHFFEECTFVEVGEALSITADAARMRVNRALEKTKELLKRRGISSTAAVLAGALSASSALGDSLPSASAIARSAITASGLHGAAAAMRLVGWLFGGMVLVGIGLAAWGWGHAHETMANGEAMKGTPSAAVASVAVPDRAPPTLERGSEPAARGSALPRVAPAGIADQEGRERTMLLRLWIGQVELEARGGPADLRFCIRPVEGSPAAACAAAIVAKGLAAVGAAGGVMLTKQGMDYGQSIGEAEASMEDLSDQQRLMLRRLWDGELLLRIEGKQADAHMGIAVEPGTPAAASAQDLLLKGLATRGSRGAVMLTLEGMAVCQADFPELAKRQPPPQD